MEELLQILDHYKLFSIAILIVVSYYSAKLSNRATKFFEVTKDTSRQIKELAEHHEAHLKSDEKFHGELFDRMNETEKDVAKIKGKLNINGSV